MKTLLPALLIALLLVGAENGPRRVGPTADGRVVVPTGQSIRAAGDTVVFGGRPVDLVLSPDGKTVYVKDNRGLVVIDNAWHVRQELPFPNGEGGSMHGIAISRDGTHLFATTAQNRLCEAAVRADGTVAWERSILLPGPEGKGASDPCGVALTSDGKSALVCLSRNNSLGVVDIDSGKLIKEIPVGVAPWGVVLAHDGRTAFVSDWGGRHARPGEHTANSSGTPVPIDSRGIAAHGAVSRVDIESGKENAGAETGLHPCDLALTADGRRLYVACANSDAISVLDAASWRVTQTIHISAFSQLPGGRAPTSLALGPDDRTLYVSLGGVNAVAVIDLGKSAAIKGLIPTGWYPGAVVSDGRTLFVANVKGLGSRRKPANARGFNSFQFSGTVNRTPIPTADALRQMTLQVRSDSLLDPDAMPAEASEANTAAVPVPTRPGETSVFQHVVYIIKENRAYDQVFGDMSRGDGDPSLVMYGRNVTPNHHALADQFVLLDNFYCNGVLSADGHSWATEGNVTDHLEKSFGGFTRSYTFGDDPLTYSSTGFLWDGALRRGLTFRNFGEMDYTAIKPAGDFEAVLKDYRAGSHKFTFTHSIGIDNLRKYSAPDAPGWNLDIPDQLRADYFLKELKADEVRGRFPNLVILYLPDDHTAGTSPGHPTPQAYLADNDLALGRVVEGISKSAFWPNTCIFVDEDDPQDGYDHVDGHRSPCLVISPYTKRGEVVHSFFNQTGVLHTIGRILDLPNMSQFVAMSPLMTDCFMNTPDLTPYHCLPNIVPLEQTNRAASMLKGTARRFALLSAKQDFSKPDLADDDMLNSILWYAAHGDTPPRTRHASSAHAPSAPDRD